MFYFFFQPKWDDDEPEFSSAEPLEEGETFFFTPRGLRNLVLTDELDSLSPVLNCEVADLANEDTPQLGSKIYKCEKELTLNKWV